MKKIIFGATLLSLTLLNGCSSGELRSFNDAMDEANGYTITYPNQSDVQYVGDVKWTVGIYNGSGYMDLKNTEDTYCKIKITFEDDSTRVYRLKAYESRNDIYMSIYNQAEYANSLCHEDIRVYDQAF